MKIFLLGMPGSGKSTLGRQLAAALRVPFVDLDDAIMEQAGQSIADIFQGKGEVYFRQLESDTLKQLADSKDDFVMATGGGAPCFHEGMEVINNAGTSIYLDVSVSTLISRTKNNSDRPLLSGDAERQLEALYVSRYSIYNCAVIKVQSENIVLNDLLTALKAKM